MFHKSKLEQYEHNLPHDSKGHVPSHTDHWQQMEFEHTDKDPNEPGISAEEKAKRIEYLNTEWWRQALQQVEEERDRLHEQHGDTFMKHWGSLVHHSPESPHGFNVEGPDFS